MAERLVQIPGRVQHVGRDDHVVAVSVEPLGDRISLDIQWAVFDAPAAVPESRLGLGEEACGDVGVDVIESPFREFGQNGCSR